MLMCLLQIEIDRLKNTGIFSRFFTPKTGFSFHFFEKVFEKRLYFCKFEVMNRVKNALTLMN